MLDKQGIMPEEDEFDAEDRLRKEIEKRNNGLLDIFAADLRSQNLSGKLIEDHIFNAHTYINLFLMTGPESPLHHGAGREQAGRVLWLFLYPEMYVVKRKKSAEEY